MQTDRPTTELYFVFAFTFCRLRVYTPQKDFALAILKIHDVEMLEKDANKDWQDVDTRLLLDLVQRALPRLIGIKLRFAGTNEEVNAILR